jgi:hypothetical protein
MKTLILITTLLSTHVWADNVQANLRWALENPAPVEEAASMTEGIATIVPVPKGLGIKVDLLALADAVRDYQPVERTAYFEGIVPAWDGGPYAQLGDTATDAISVLKTDVPVQTPWYGRLWDAYKAGLSDRPVLTAGGTLLAGGLLWWAGDEYLWGGDGGGGGSPPHITVNQTSGDGGNNNVIIGEGNTTTQESTRDSENATAEPFGLP